MGSNNICVLFLLLGCVVEKGYLKTDTCKCDTYTGSEARKDDDCSGLKTLLSCVLNQTRTTHCDVPKDNIHAIQGKNSTICEPKLKDACECQTSYWRNEFNLEGARCKALGEFKICLDAAKTTTGCGSETLDDLKTFVTDQENTNTCPTPAPATESSSQQDPIVLTTPSKGARTTGSPEIIVISVLTMITFLFI